MSLKALKDSKRTVTKIGLVVGKVGDKAAAHTTSSVREFSQV